MTKDQQRRKREKKKEKEVLKVGLQGNKKYLKKEN